MNDHFEDTFGKDPDAWTPKQTYKGVRYTCKRCQSMYGYKVKCCGKTVEKIKFKGGNNG